MGYLDTSYILKQKQTSLLHLKSLKQYQTLNMCGIFSTLLYETYEVWDAVLLGLGSILVRLGL